MGNEISTEKVLMIVAVLSAIAGFLVMFFVKDRRVSKYTLVSMGIISTLLSAYNVYANFGVNSWVCIFSGIFAIMALASVILRFLFRFLTDYLKVSVAVTVVGGIIIFFLL